MVISPLKLLEIIAGKTTMRITQLHLKNFKRFTDLLIDHIPPDTKLVLLIGSNGSGKSSVFDAFGFVDHQIKRDIYIHIDDSTYYKKKGNQKTSVSLCLANGRQYEILEANSKPLDLSQTCFYGRSSFRQTPRLTNTYFGKMGEYTDFKADTDRPKYLIDWDERFENDIENIIRVVLQNFFRANQSNEQIRDKYIHPINLALERIFGGGNGTRLQLIEIIPPLEGKVAQITFRKGGSEIHYNYLSAGEKEVFNLLINLLSRGPLYQDTVYYLDEIDLHLNTKLQFNLLQEITENWIPENCQLWTASHSLGFIEYAKQQENAVIIDFDDLDFDLPQVLNPQPKDNPDIYEIAVGKEFLPALFQSMDIYFVENKDREYYAAAGIPQTVFVSENNRNSVYHKVKSTSDFKGIVDRDFLSDDDVAQIRQHYPQLRILDYYSIENYLYHPDNLQDYHTTKHQSFDRGAYILQLTEAKNQAKASIISMLPLNRITYPYFGEPEHNNSILQNRFKNKEENGEQVIAITNYLHSDNFEIYYKALPMKSYCTQLPQRQNVSKTELAKTAWFKTKIMEVLQKK
jgi:predicted ATP-binding protein involved in virulence